MTEVNFNKIDLGDRCDAEYYGKLELHVEDKLRKLGAAELREFGFFVASAFYPAATQLYATGDTPFIRCVDCINYPIITKEQDDLFEKIPKEFILNNKGVNTLKKGELVITKVGTPSYPSIILEHEEVALSRTVLGIKNIIGLNSLYLLVFLRSKYGFSQLQRERELTIQYQLTLERVKKTLVFVPSKNFQSAIEKLVLEYIKQLNISKNLYSQAEAFLLQSIGLQDFKPSTEAVNVKGFKESFGASGRLDAEYYQKKYEEVIKHITSQNYATLKDIVSIKKSIEPGSDVYADEGLPFLRVADYNKFGITDPDKKLSYTFCNENAELINKLKPKKETILFSKDGSVGTAYMLRKDEEMITSGAILHLNVRDKKQIIPEYLTLALNSQIVKMQSERDAGGSIILHWRISEIENVVVPIISIEKQKEIASLVEESFRLKKQSEQLLEAAKKAVEMAIEEGEERAMEWMYVNTGI